MNVDFSKTGEGAVPVEQTAPVENTNNAVAPAQQCSVPATHQPPPMSEIVLPRLNLVHSVGLLKDQHPVGSYVYNQSLLLTQAAIVNTKTGKTDREALPPLNVTFLQLRPIRFKEKVAGGGMGLVADSLDEVAQLGGTTNYKEAKLKEASGMKLFQYSRDCLLAIERPEHVADDETTFVFDVEGRKYALCLYTMRASAYNVLKKSVQTDEQIGCLRKGLSTYSYSLSCRLEPTPDKQSTYWLPTLVPNKPSTPAFLDFAKQVLERPKAEVSDDCAGD